MLGLPFVLFQHCFRVHICGKRYIDRVEDETRVTVYSNLPEVELFVNGQSLGKQRSNCHFFYFRVPNKGETVLKAVAEDCIDESMIRKVAVFNEEYRLKEKGAILNWFDITQKEGYLSLNDKMSDILKTKEGETLFLELMKNMGKDKQEGAFAMTAENIGPMMQMMGSFTLIRLINTFGAVGPAVNKEQLLELNARLNQIRKI